MMGSSVFLVDILKSKWFSLVRKFNIDTQRFLRSDRNWIPR